LSPTTPLLAVTSTWNLGEQGESIVKPDVIRHINNNIIISNDVIGIAAKFVNNNIFIRICYSNPE